jgi:hypothetical protein
MPKPMTAQEEGRKKREAEKKDQLDALGGSGNTAAASLAARATDAKEMKKILELASKKSRKEAADNATKWKAAQSGTAPPPSNNTKKVKQKAKRAKPPKKADPEQGQRKVPVPCDTHGCDHHGLLEFLKLERSLRRAFVKKGGWLHENPAVTVQRMKLEATSE